MDQAHRTAIQMNKSLFCSTVNLSQLVQTGRTVIIETSGFNSSTTIFNETEVTEVTTEIDAAAQFDLILDIIRRKPYDVFDWIMEYLQKQGYDDLAEAIYATAQSEYVRIAAETIDETNVQTEQPNPIVFRGLSIDPQPIAFANGGFGSIYRCRGRCDRSVECAVKETKIPTGGRNRAHVLSALHHEESVISILLKLENHPNIIKFIFCHRTELKFCIFLEYLSGGDLHDYVEANRAQTEKVTIEFLRQIVNGLKFLHSHEIAHYDMKSGNVLLDDAQDPKVLKICDYGLSKNFSSQDAISSTFNYRGTEAFMAPEVVAAKANKFKELEDKIKFNRKSDIWSVGIIGLHLMTGELRSIKPSEVPPDLLASANTLVVSILKRLLVVVPEDRCDVVEAADLIQRQSISTVTCNVITVPPLVEKSELEAHLVDLFSHNSNSLLEAVEMLNAVNNSYSWIGVSCLRSDELSFHGNVVVKDDVTQRHFYWYDQNPEPIEGPSVESVKLFVDSNQWVSKSALDVSLAGSNQFGCVLSKYDNAIVVGTDDVFIAESDDKLVTLYKC